MGIHRHAADARIDDGDRLAGYRAAARDRRAVDAVLAVLPGHRAATSRTTRRRCGCTRSRSASVGRGFSAACRCSSRATCSRTPRRQDFFSAVSKGAGADLTWYFNQVYRSVEAFDYGIQRFDSAPAAISGYKDADRRRVYVDADDRPTRYVTELVVRRYKGTVLPVDIVVTFADGREQIEHWDGAERWRLFRWEGTSRATTAAVDPKRKLTLDVNYTNNTWHLDPDGPRAARKWSWRWLIWLQDELLTWVSLV